MDKSHKSIIQRGAMLVKTHIKEVKDLKSLTKGHVLYFFEVEDQYITNVVDFIISGLELNEHSVIVENDRFIPLIKKRLMSLFSEETLKKVIFVNNYDFYYSKGDFRINSIFEFLPNLLEDDQPQGLAVRSWAHIEWRDEQEVCKKLSDSEKAADLIVTETKLFSVCAYDSKRVSEELKENLLTTHKFLINDQE